MGKGRNLDVSIGVFYPLNRLDLLRLGFQGLQ